jgi:hypothetical protein
MDASSWFTDTITVQSPSGIAASGSRDVVWGPQRQIKCRYNAGQKKVMTSDGTVVTTVATIRCTDEITIHDRVWPPLADVTDNSKARRPAQALSTTNKQGYTLWRIELG